jgi:PAS domain S-box-containing protein/diguanylate cyclase (GGDEF)-like protein/putative nucleotidyltransferase with HDIG domain
MSRAHLDHVAAEATAEQLAAIVESSQDAIIAWSLDGVVTSWNESAERLLGFTRGAGVDMKVGDLWGLEERPDFADIVRRLADGEQIPPYEGARQRDDGGSVEVSVTLSPIKDAEGAVIGASSVFRDIGEHKRAREQLIEERNRWEGAFRVAPIGMALVGLDGQWLAVNRALCELLGRCEDDLLSTDFQALSHPEDLDHDLGQLSRVLAGEIEGYELEKRYFRPGGEVVWANLNVSLVRHANNDPAYFVSQLQDVTARREAEAELARYAKRLDELARLDPLTGLRNHRDFRTVLDHELARARRHGQLWSLALFTIEDLARISRQDYGRAEQLICQVAGVISNASRSSDWAARIGEGDFAIVLPSTEPGAARQAADRIASAVRRTGIGRLSYGIASWPDDGSSVDQLLQCCDTQLRTGNSGAPTPRRSHATAAVDQSASDAIAQIVSLAQAHLEMDVAYLAEIEDTRQGFATVRGDGASFGIAEGGSLDWDDNYCRLMLDHTVPHAITDASQSPDLNALAITRRAGIGSYIGVPVRLANGHIYGTLCALSHEPRPDLGNRNIEVMQSLAVLLAAELQRGLDQRSQHRSEVERTGIHALLSALEARDQYTGEHSKTVVTLATGVAERLGLNEDRTREVEHVALLHDIGKVGVPDSILQKRDRLTDEEWVLMRQHPAIGARILAATRSLAHFAAAVNAEHERFDGAGYPDGLAGDAIPLASRITLACDAYHAMTSDRPYRAAMDNLTAQAEMRAGAGSQFDPEVVDALLAALEGTPYGPLHPDRAADRDVLIAHIPLRKGNLTAERSSHSRGESILRG